MDWRDISDDKEKYAAYLCSREWGVKRQAVFDRCGGLCERCCSSYVDAVHHLNYLRKYDERPEDLQGLCDACHKFLHGRSDVDPRDRFREVLLASKKSGENVLLCPDCRSEHTAIGKTYFSCGDIFGEASAGMVCENGHAFVIRFLSTGGMTRLFANTMPSVDPQDPWAQMARTSRYRV